MEDNSFVILAESGRLHFNKKFRKNEFSSERYWTVPEQLTEQHLWNYFEVPTIVTRRVWSTFLSFLHCLLIFLSSTMLSINLGNMQRKSSGMLRIEPRAAEWEVQMLLLCYAVPTLVDFLTLLGELWSRGKSGRLQSKVPWVQFQLSPNVLPSSGIRW